jgi:uncharacterized membrane protein HdeD (DUF308 family)
MKPPATTDAAMVATYERLAFAELRRELTAFRRNWLWFVILGAVLIVAGAVALGSLAVASLATAVAIGALLLAGGVAETVGAVRGWGWRGYFLHLLSGVLSVVVGVLFLWAPGDALLALTLLLACLLLVGGAFKISAALSYQFDAWGWPLLSGVVDLFLGLLIWQQWPASAFWVIGLFVGISLVFRGANWIGLGLALRPRRPRIW